jgi:S1-C subfamily serine protease
MEEGDAIVAIAGQVVRDIETLRAALSKLEPGKTVPVEVLRGDERVTLKVTLGGRPAR